MAEQNTSLLNRLERDLPEGLVVDAAWLQERGIASNLRAYYVKNGWLEQPVRSVYKKPRGTLELQGFAHYLAHETRIVHLYGPEKPPAWLNKLQLPQRFVYHNSATLFRNEPITQGLGSFAWGQWDWPMTLSQPERAYLEMLDELPRHESFHQADMIMQSAANFSPRRLQKLLLDCDSVKVKRLFFYFADRHGHAWLKRLDKTAIDLGKGKRMLVPGGKLDPVYHITVPRDFDGIS